jgi:circadian clock protein KaiC
MRGAMHRKGDFGFTVLSGQGVVVLPQAIIQYGQETEPRRVGSGIAGIDEMSGGGFFHDSIVLVNGPTGTGKTLMCTHFLDAGAAAGEKVLLLSYEESPGQLFRNAAAWGLDLVQHQEKGLLKVVALYPEVASLDDHLIEIMDVVDSFRPTRIVVDSLSSLERIGSSATYREFVIALAAFVKQEQITMMVTLSTPALLGGSTQSEGHISTLTDAIVLLRYAPREGEVSRVLTLLKMRGSAHDSAIRSYAVSSDGLVVGEPVTGAVSL